MDHFINQCKVCDKVISQCKCMGDKKVNKDLTCKDCQPENTPATTSKCDRSEADLMTCP
jgi:hypothetical protein